jgi:hypothetical protein
MSALVWHSFVQSLMLMHFLFHVHGKIEQYERYVVQMGGLSLLLGALQQTSVASACTPLVEKIASVLLNLTRVSGSDKKYEMQSNV